MSSPRAACSSAAYEVRARRAPPEVARVARPGGRRDPGEPPVCSGRPAASPGHRGRARCARPRAARARPGDQRAVRRVQRRERVACRDLRARRRHRDLGAAVEQAGEAAHDADVSSAASTWHQTCSTSAMPVSPRACPDRAFAGSWKQRRVDGPPEAARGERELVARHERHLVTGGRELARPWPPRARPAPRPRRARRGSRCGEARCRPRPRSRRRSGRRGRAAGGRTRTRARTGRTCSPRPAGCGAARVADGRVDPRLPGAAAGKRPRDERAVVAQAPGAVADQGFEEVGCGHPLGVLGWGSCPSRSIFPASPVGSAWSRCGRRRRPSRCPTGRRRLPSPSRSPLNRAARAALLRRFRSRPRPRLRSRADTKRGRPRSRRARPAPCQASTTPRR